MIVLLICVLVSVVLFGCFVVLKSQEFQEKFEIYEKLLKSVQDRLDKHNL